jgi:hypothetical protein
MAAILVMVVFSFCLLSFSLIGSETTFAQTGGPYVVSDVSGEAEYIVWTTQPDGTKVVQSRQLIQKGMAVAAGATVSVPEGSVVTLTNPNDPNDVVELVGPVDFNSATGELETYSGELGETIPSPTGDISPADLDFDSPTTT